MPNNFVSVLDYGADPSGTNSSKQAFIDAISENDNVIVPDGTYIDVGGITINRSNVRVDLTTAKIYGSGNNFLSIGQTRDTPSISNITIKGGEFFGASGADVRFVMVKGAEDVIIENCTIRNVGNGGITIEAGTYNTTIRDCRVLGNSGHSTIRGIWINGSNASDYASNLMDNDTLTRNDTPAPTIQADTVSIINCEVAVGSYAIYSMNTNNLKVSGCHIHTFGGARGISLNTYSPNSIITGNTIEGTTTSSGVMVTQVSEGTIISNNIFRGQFGGGRQIQVQYLAEALITNNQFLAGGEYGIDVNTAGVASIVDNYFERPTSANSNQRAIYHVPLDRNVVNSGTYGQSAVDVPGIIVQGNIFKKWGAGLYQTTQLLPNDNAPGIRTTIFSGNSYLDDPDVSRPASNGPYYCGPVDNNTNSGPGTNTIDACYRNNTVAPRSRAYKNKIIRAGDKTLQNVNYIDNTVALSAVYVKAINSTTCEENWAYGPQLVTSPTNNISGGGFKLTPRAPYGVSLGGEVPALVAAFPTSNGDPWFSTYQYVQTPAGAQNNTITIRFYAPDGSEVDTRTSAAFGKSVLLLFISGSK